MKNMISKLFQIVLLSGILFAANQAQDLLNWGTRADHLRGRDGQRFTFSCPGDGTTGRLWGTDIYTDDSSICTAAVHTGLISAKSGGVITIEVRAGASSYAASTRNGVTSQAYGSWHGSFVVVGGNGGSYQDVEFEDGSTARIERKQATWSMQADRLRGNNGQRFLFACPPEGTASGRLWGTDVYTDDSSVCTAALHAGLISRAAGGNVVIEIRPGAGSYIGSKRNGLTSKGYGAYNGSFVFVRVRRFTTLSVSPGVAQHIKWTTQADAWRGQNGRRFTLQCPAGGAISGRLWGTGLYTDDSSICTAAVHAGLIASPNGGVVTIEIRGGAPSYAGSTRNGVMSNRYGSWGGSFVFVK